MNGYLLSKVTDPLSVITAIDNKVKFPESTCAITIDYYINMVNFFRSLVFNVNSNYELLNMIRINSNSKDRITLLKIFRRVVSPILDTESSKKINTISTQSLINAYGESFKDFNLLRDQMKSITECEIKILANLLAEYDGRGASGYELTRLFFNWFVTKFPFLKINGPIGAGKDIEFRDVFNDFHEKLPCDFVIYDQNLNPIAVGFARYDSTRGGSQSDDRTSGNTLKVEKISGFCDQNGIDLKIIFLSDGPGLSHRDTWYETVQLDHRWGGRVRVTTLKTLDYVVTREWLL